MTIYERIRYLRQSQKMSQTDLARKLGYKDGSIITKIESGLVDISQKKIVAFAEALDTTPAYLMGWTDGGDDTDPDSINGPPRTEEARIVSHGIDQLPKAQREMVLNVVRAMFIEHADLFTKGNEQNDDA